MCSGGKFTVSKEKAGNGPRGVSFEIMPIPRATTLRRGLSLQDNAHQLLDQNDLKVATVPSDEERQRTRRAQEQYLCIGPPPFVHEGANMHASVHKIFYEPETHSLCSAGRGCTPDRCDFKLFGSLSKMQTKAFW